MSLFENAYSQVAALVRKFDEHKDQFLAPKYQEDSTRKDLLDDFWSALGWDAGHREQTNPREQEVKISKSDTAGSTRRVDYAFYLKPDYRNPVFFCEAKKPSRDLYNADDYFQLVRYGYGASTPVGALTNFDEFHIIDCRYQPHIDKSYPSAQIKVFGYKQYLDKEAFGFIYWIFSREAVEAGKLKEYAKSLPKQQGKGAAKLTAEEAKPVDEAFLTKLEDYRRILAKAFKKADENLNAEVLTEATQKVIDRLVFIRFLEDKYIETDYIVDQIGAKKGGAWKSFLSWSKELDVKYNGVVFKPHDIDKSEWKAPDDKTFADLCADISHTHSKYLFTYIPIELLGSIYERFLGKVVTTTSKRAEIEDKPEVRKAGGVYYTPKYIVDYIVGNTVGKILVAPASSPVPISPNANGDRGQARTPALQGLSPKEISKLRFADIACGSGSFLIAVYDTVLHHVEKWYNDHPDDAKKAKCTEIEKGIFALSLKQKQQILLDNIYGVDIDRQAVEVAQLSLFLKLLESESGATAEQLSFERTKILPDLSKNIQCGNSLVEYDISDLFPLTDAQEKNVNPFNFATSFKEIMGNGGFDAIVGNPPYLAYYGKQSVKKERPEEYEYLSRKKDFLAEYPTKRIGSTMFFIYRAIGLLKQGGGLSYIVDMNIHEDGFKGIRKFMFTSSTFEIIVPFLRAFQKVSSGQTIFALSKGPNIDYLTAITDDLIEYKRVPERNLIEDGYALRYNPYLSILKKIDGPKCAPLAKIASTTRGMVISKDFVFMEQKSAKYHKCVFGRNVTRYGLKYPTEGQLRNEGGRGLFVIHDKAFEAKINRQFKAEHRNTINVIGNEARFTKEKLFVRYTPSFERIEATYDNDGFFSDHTLSLVYDPVGYNLKYILAILNSRMMGFYAMKNRLIKAEKGKIPQFPTKKLGMIPIRKIDPRNPAEVALQNSILRQTDLMLIATNNVQSASSDSNREQLQRKCDYIDGEIDRLVYELYGLTAEEIKIVEGQ